MCDCLAKATETLRKAYGDPEAEFKETSGYPALVVTYRPKRHDGTFEHKREFRLTPPFCPFCGKRCDEGDQG